MRVIWCSSVALLLALLINACYSRNAKDEWSPIATNAKAIIPRLEVQLQKEGPSIKLLNELAIQYWILGDLVRASQLLEQASKSEPNDVRTQINLAQVLWHEGRYAQAVVHAKRFLEFDSSSERHLKWAQNRIEKFERFSSKTTTQTPPLLPAQTEQSNSIRMIFVRIPGGTFSMGSDSGPDDARPIHRITLSPYWMGKYEVTVAQYEMFLKDTDFKPIPPRSARGPSDEHPASEIEWRDAEAFSIWLSTKEQTVYRLPTEAEWEFASRGDDSRMYPWGKDSPNVKLHGNWGRIQLALQGGRGALEPVGRFPAGASPFGIYDMAGNVSEWCIDDYISDYYELSPKSNPFGPFNPTGFHKVQRGSSWRDSDDMQTIARSGVESNLCYDHHGFRLVRVQD